MIVSRYILSPENFMKNIGFKQVSLLLGASTLILGFNELKVQAETVSSSTVSSITNEAIASPNSWETAPINTHNSTPAASPLIKESAAKPIPGTTRTSASSLRNEIPTVVAPTVAQTEGTTPGNTTPGTTTPGTTTPGTTTPGTVTPGTFTPGTPAPDTTTPGTTTPGTFTPGTTTPGTRVITPGRSTRSGSSYFGVGGNIGLGDGDTAIGEGSFAVLSKIGLTRDFSIRPSILIEDNATILLPLTYDFTFGEGPTGELGFTAAPFWGAGAAISTGDDTSVDLLLTGGIDVPLGTQFTATASVNASVTGNVAVGLLLGIGYNFNGF